MMDGVEADGGLSRAREEGQFLGDFEDKEFAGLMPAVALVERDVRREKNRPSGP
jgi:hypothetical protein